jgi:hypothetical protein
VFLGDRRYKAQYIFRGKAINTALNRQERKERGFEYNGSETWIKITERNSEQN